VRRKSLTEFAKGHLLSRVAMSTKLERLRNADLVIEAVYEDIEVKRKLLAELEPHLSDRCVIASNTSALPITEIAKHSARKDRIVGMHYFSPVHKMPLLEIVTTKDSSKDATGVAVNVGLKQGKTIIVVRDSPGFYTSRILAPLLDEAAIVALEGIGPHEIDLYMEQFGFPVGPITLMDEVGIDVAAHVAKELVPHFGPRIATADRGALEMMMARNFLGRKSGRGFYVYEGTKSPLARIKGLASSKKPINTDMREIFMKYRRQPVLRSITAHDIQLRIALRMVNEAMLCLQEEVLRSPEDGDVGAVFGLGFPPFIGGPFRYVDLEGADKVVANLKRFADHFGAHFEPAPLLADMAKGAKKFFK
jgi:enoyl-CoA hydratase/long-chain 3-hydroxyacyl-CoA dehydrogenase